MKYRQSIPPVPTSTSERRMTRSSSAFTVTEDMGIKAMIHGDQQLPEPKLQGAVGGMRKKPAVKKTKQSKSKKRPGRFRIAYTNRKAIKALSESGNNELSMDSMSFLTDEEKLLLSSWGLPSQVLSRYRQKGVTNLFQWQLQCLDNEKVLRGSNILYSAPTSAGKTLVAEILMLKRVLELGKKAIFILPFVSVAREKMYSLQELFGDVGIRVEGFMGTYNPPGGFQQVDIAVCTIEKANSLINKLLEEGSLSQLGTIVVDELHLIGDPHRGYLLELLLTKIRFSTKRKSFEQNSLISMSLNNSSINQQESLLERSRSVRGLNIQIIGMSATLPNLTTLAKWLEAELVVSDFRPVPLVEHIKIGDSLFDASLARIGPTLKDSLLLLPNDPDHIMSLSLETILDGHSILTFCPSKQMCEKTAVRIAHEFFKIGDPTLISGRSIILGEKLRAQLQGPKISELLAQLAQCPSGLDEALRKAVSFGVAFHHAGLTFDERDIIESAFKRGIIRVMVATSTLSAGVNLPARRVLIVTPSFDALDILTYRQMSGRAGRKGVDTHGESILICDSKTQKRALNLIQANLPPVKSALFGSNGSVTSSLKRALLEVIASGVVKNPGEVDDYTHCTLLHHIGLQDDGSDLSGTENKDIIARCLEFLEKNDFIRLKQYESEQKSPEYMTTQLGAACLASSLSPDEGIFVFKELQKARRCFVLENELHVIYQVTPIYIAEQWRNLDWHQFLAIWQSLSSDEKEVGKLIGVNEGFILKATMGLVSWRNPSQMAIINVHQRFFTALALNDLVNEMPISKVTEKYSVNKGVVQNLQQSASTFAGMVTAFCNRLGWSNLELLLSQFQERLQFGVQRELVDLVRLDLLNGQRARILHNAGIKTMADLATSEPATIAQIFHQAGPFSSNVHGGQSAKSIWMLGKDEGLTEAEAAQMIVQEARDFLQIELGLAGVKFRKDESEHCGKENLQYINEDEEDRQRMPATEKTEPLLEGSVLVHDFHNASAVRTDAHSIVRQISPGESENSSGIEFRKNHSTPINYPVTTITSLVAAMQQSTPKHNTQNEICSDSDSSMDSSNRVKPDKTQSLEREDYDCDTQFLYSKFDSTCLIEPIETTGAVNEYLDLMIGINEKDFLDSKFDSEPFVAAVDTMDDADVDIMATSFMDVSLIDVEDDMNADICSKQLLSESILVTAAAMAEDVADAYNNSIDSDSSIEYFPPSPKNITLKSPKSSFVQKCPEVRQSPRISPQLFSSAGFSDDDDDDDGAFVMLTPKYHLTPEILYFQQLPSIKVFGIDFKVKKITKPELLPEDTFRSDGAIGLGLNIIFPAPRRTSTGIGIRILGRRVSVSARMDEDCHRLALCNGATETIWLYEWTAGDEIGLKVIFKKFNATSSKLTILNGKEKLKILLENSKIFLNQLPTETGIWDPKIAQWLLRFDEDRAITQDEMVRLWVDASDSGKLQRYRSQEGSSAGKFLKALVESLLAWNIMLKLSGKLQLFGLWKHFLEIETPSVRSLLLMELNGFKINMSELQRLKEILEFHVAALELTAYRIAGRSFNLSSSKEISQVLRHDLGLGEELSSRRTGKQVLKKVNHEFARVILEWRRVNGALWKTVIPFLAENTAGRIYGHYSHLTITGRVVMADPSLQCVPRDFTLDFSYNEAQIEDIRNHCRIHFGNKAALLEKLKKTEFGVESIISPRTAFVPSDSFILLSADYSQLELRILAHLAHETKLISILNRPTGDVFREIAAEWKCIPESDVTDDMRQEAKGITYGIIYGMGAKTLSDQLEVDERDAAEFIQGFMWAYPGIRTFIDETIKSCRDIGYVETISGRRRYLEHINSKSSAQRAQAERQAVNSRIQGSASDLVKRAMVETQSKFSALYPASANYVNWSSADPLHEGVIVFPVLNLHDELIFEVRKSHLQYVATQIKYHMESSLKLAVKTPVVVKCGPDWGHLHPYAP